MKLKSIFLFTLFLFISQINIGFCSENVSVPPLPPQVEQGKVHLPPEIEDKQVSEGKQRPQQTVKQTPIAPPVEQTVGAAGQANSNNGFVPVFINMLASLFKIIILIIAAAAIIILYRRMKLKAQSALKPEKRAEKEYEDSNIEPTNVSEAVSSFVRRKIKKHS